MDKENGFILIGTVSVILLIFLLAFLTIMLIYRKRKISHAKEVKIMNEHFTKEILNTQIGIQQQTMQHIGREIHDNVGQKLTLAALYIQQLDSENKNAATQKRIASVAAILNESLNDLRSLSKNLTETGNLDTDLYDLVNNECLNVNAAGSCFAELKSNTRQIQVSLTVKNFVLRVLQEFLQNSLKHANCTEIKVALENEQKGLTINVYDNGKGFLSNDKSYTGIGLKNIKKRAEIIGADLTIDSSPGEGTKMHLFIPANKFNI